MFLLAAVLSLQAPSFDSLPSLVWPAEHPEAVLGENPLIVVRRETVELDYGLLLPTALGGASSFTLALTAGDTVTVHFERRAEARGGFVWYGTLAEDAHGSAVFSLVGDKVSASIRYQDRLYRMSYAGGGLHYVAQLDEQAFPACATTSAHEISLPAVQGGNGQRGVGNPDVDVMVVYTTQAKNNQGGSNAISSLINLAVSETNTGYQKSDVTQRLVLVYSQEEVGYTENGNFSTELSRLRSKNDGHMDDVHSLRDQYGADCVTLIVAGSQYCGIAYLMTNVSAGFESNAFSVVSRSCATGYYSFGHELGHNMGCAHDSANAGSAAYNYSYGWRTSNNAYRTVMAYSPGSRINYYSNPSKSKNGYALGNTNSAENWKSLNNTASTVAAWRDSATSSFTLTHTTLLRGWWSQFAADGADNNEVVWFLGSPAAGTNVFPPELGGLGLDISHPIRILGSGTADSSGHASTRYFLPSSLPVIPVYLQAVIVRGNGGIDSVKTDLVSTQIY